MESSLLLVLIGLVLALVVIKSLIGLLFRYVLFVGIALLVFVERYGPEVASWMDASRAAEIGVIAAAALVATTAISVVFFRRSRLRFALVPATGVATTLLAARLLS